LRIAFAPRPNNSRPYFGSRFVSAFGMYARSWRWRPHVAEHPAMAKIITVREVAKWLKVSPWSVYRAAAAGRLPAFRLAEGGSLRFEEDKVREALDARQQVKVQSVQA
jgi:excisionase family DNA binding protein